jgi:putative phage-type endonuclease
MIAPGTPEWIMSRKGCLTGSRMAAAMSFNKDGKESAKRRDLKIELLSERLTDIATDHYVSPPMQWGLDHEAEAVEAYEAASGNIVAPAGYIPHPTIEYFGATPDGLIDDDGVFEAKCPTSTTHVEWMLKREVPPEYRPQMIVEMLCTRRRFCDFVSFDPRMPKERKLFVRRYEPKPEEIAAVESAAVAFLKELEAMFDQITTA